MNDPLKQVESSIRIFQVAGYAGQVVERNRVFRFDGLGSRRPIFRPINFSEFQQGERTRYGRARIFRIGGKFAFRQLDGSLGS